MLRVLNTINHSGTVYKAGDIIKGLSEKESERLLRLRAVEKVVTEKEIEQKVNKFEVDPDVFKELRDALDENYNADELKAAAREVGVQFESNATKEKVMEAIITQGKADELLEDEDGE